MGKTILNPDCYQLKLSLTKLHVEAYINKPVLSYDRIMPLIYRFSLVNEVGKVFIYINFATHSHIL